MRYAYRWPVSLAGGWTGLGLFDRRSFAMSPGDFILTGY